jgi:CheY-like chemotaxis protein
MKPKSQNLPLNILLAEDDSDDRFFFAKALNELSIESHLIKVHDGEQLMNYLSENVENLPDVLFLDLSMPRKTGFECLSEIKENKLIKYFPIIMFSTSYARDKSYEQDMINILYNLGANDYIRKPNDYEKLKQVIYHSLLKVQEKKLHNKQEGNL